MITSISLMTKPELEQLSRELTCFLIPIGGVEGHGDHLPLGTKLLHAEDWAYALAQKLQSQLTQWNFVILPLIPLTVDSSTSDCHLNVRPHVVRDAIVDQCERLKARGFLNFAALSTNLSPRQLMAIEDAGKLVSRGGFLGFGKKAHLVSISSALVSASEGWSSPMISIPNEHAGASDTGLVLKINPAWIRGDWQKLPSVERPKPSVSRFMDYFKGKVGGYWGNPSAASPEYYMQDLDRKNASLAESLKVVLESGKGVGAFRSSYRFFPLNGSFFKAYFMATLFFLMMLIWVIWSLKGNFDVDA